MNIDPLNNSSYVQQSRINGRPKPQEESVSAELNAEKFSAQKSENVRLSLATMPEVRPEVVERGRQLLADQNYPSQEIVKKIAQLITPLSED